MPRQAPPEERRHLFVRQNPCQVLSPRRLLLSVQPADRERRRPVAARGLSGLVGTCRYLSVFVGYCRVSSAFISDQSYSSRLAASSSPQAGTWMMMMMMTTVMMMMMMMMLTTTTTTTMMMMMMMMMMMVTHPCALANSGLARKVTRWGRR
jgi:hypothetical protein